MNTPIFIQSRLKDRQNRQHEGLQAHHGNESKIGTTGTWRIASDLDITTY